MSKNETFQYRPHHSKSLDEAQIQEAILLHEAGWSNVAIGKKLGRHNSNIQRLLKKMGCPSVNKDMTVSDKPNKESPRRVYGCSAPRSVENPGVPSDSTTGANDITDLQKKVAALEKELKETKLRAALYDEMIKVAEQRFDIQIRKKAGAKR